MKTGVLPTIFLIASSGQLFGQKVDSIKVVINHVFFCIDSTTYANLFKHEFIAKEFAVARELSTTTLTDSWTGKYLTGRQSYVEVFASHVDQGTDPELGDKFGDLGIVFETEKSGDIQKLHQLIKIDKPDVRLKVNEYDSNGKIIPFTYNLYLANSRLEKTFRPYVDERTMVFLKSCGFSESEIKSGVTEEQFREKRRGKKFEKLYDNIERIELILTSEEFQYLAESLKYFGFLQIGNRFNKSGFEIVCSVEQARRFKLKAIHFSLRSEVNDVNIEVSKNLTFKASGKKASFHFTYE
jgi:hypothetical protein